MNESLHPSVFPSWVRWVRLVRLAVSVPSYAVYWGWANFLHLCDVGVFLACLGFAYNNALLLSSQAVSSLVGDLVWCLDVGWRWFVGRHLTGGTEYMGIYVGRAVPSLGAPTLTVPRCPACAATRSTAPRGL